MELTNYWWLLIWIFFGGFLMSRLPKQTEVVNGKEVERWSWLAGVLLVIPYIIWAGFRGDIGDTTPYRKAFIAMPSTLAGLPKYIDTLTKDQGFSVLSILIKVIFGDSDIIYFLILAIIQMGCLVKVFRKYSCNYWLSIFLFIISTEYIGWMYNGIRQFIAATLIYAATDYLMEKKYVPLIGVILLAATIHASALLMIPIVFIIHGKAWNKKTVLCIILSIVVLFYVEQFTEILDELLAETQYTNVVSDWEEFNDDGTNPLRVLLYSIPMLLSIVGIRQIKELDDPVINMATNASIITTGLYLISMVTSGIFMGRLPIYVSLYSMCILLPWEIQNLFEEKSIRLMEMMMVGCYIVFFYMQMHSAWGLL